MARREVVPIELFPPAPLPAFRSHPLPLQSRPSVAVLRFALPRTAAGTVAVYSAQGALVRTILSGELTAGEHACAWDGRDESDIPAPAGSYSVRLEVADRILTSRRVVIA